VDKIAKKNRLKECNTVPCCQKYTPTYCFLGDFTHWVKNKPHSYMIYLRY